MIVKITSLYLPQLTMFKYSAKSLRNTSKVQEGGLYTVIINIIIYINIKLEGSARKCRTIYINTTKFHKDFFEEFHKYRCSPMQIIRSAEYCSKMKISDMNHLDFIFYHALFTQTCYSNLMFIQNSFYLIIFVS